MSRRSQDVMIVGAGPVGLVTALCCARQGLPVRVLDRASPPIDKACGEGVMPDGVARLAELGIDLEAAGGRPFRGIRYLDGERTVAASFPDRPGVGIRRTRLHAALLEAAHDAGVRFDFGVTARGLVTAGPADPWVAVETDGGRVEGRWLVGADGLDSRVRRWSGLEAGPRGARLAVRRHYGVRPWSDVVEVHWSDGCEAYVTPVGSNEVGVAILFAEPKGRFDELLSRFPELSTRIEGAPTLSRDRGCGPLERRVRGVCAGRVALVGDAAGYLDAISGEGITTGVAQAEALAAALRSGRLRDYRRAHRRIQRRPNLLTRGLLLVSGRPGLRRRLMASFTSDPELFERLLEVHIGARRPVSVGWRGLVGAGRMLLAETPS